MKVAVIGLGYVGLPLVVEFGRLLPTIGFDIDEHKVASCKRGVDPSRELPDEEMAAATQAEYTADPKRLAEADVIIIAVPTPVDDAHRPDFAPLIGSSDTAGRHMKKGAIVVYESTVYPGATEEVCIPAIEKASGIKWKQDFFVGYGGCEGPDSTWGVRGRDRFIEPGGAAGRARVDREFSLAQHNTGLLAIHEDVPAAATWPLH